MTMYSSVQCLCGLPLTQHCYVKPWAPCSSAQQCRHPLQACSKHSPLSGQQAAALLSPAKQLRAPTASTAVTRVKRALSLTHKHMLGGLPLPVHGRNEKGRACAASYGQRGDGLGQSHSHSAVLKHVPPAHTCRKKHAGTQGQGIQTESAAAHHYSCSPQERMRDNCSSKS